jgi:long-chain acyl-CoA synthetase
VANLCIFADSYQNYPVAIIVPIEKSLSSFLEDKDTEMEFKELVKHDKIKQELFKELLEVGKKSGLKGSELLGNITIVADEWTAANGCLTAAQKINRTEIAKLYAKEIKEMYYQTRQ